MTTMRFNKEPGSPVMQSTEEPAVLIMDGPPDDVRLPPELGGFIERVRESFQGPCPRCQQTVRHLVLESCSVAECRPCGGFLWYRKKGSDR
jgi:hypothetical protein